MRKFTADFETTTDKKDCRVWAWGVCEIGNPTNFIYGNTIEGFIEWCSNTKENYEVYFHNLKFDVSFIFDYLLRNDYKLNEHPYYKKGQEFTRPSDKTFTCLIDDLGNFYSAEIWFSVEHKKANKVKIYDSLKLLNFSVEFIGKKFNLKTEDGEKLRKLKLDYNEYREVGHELSEIEVAYLRHDVEVMARALDIVFNKGLTKSTLASNALTWFKNGIDNFRELFPIQHEITFKDMKPAYKGGFTYLNPLYKEVLIDKPLVCLDVNSLYPSVMRTCILPYDNGIYYEGKYNNENEKYYPLYIQHLKCSFEVKKNKIPTIQLKGNMLFKVNEYITTTHGEIVELKLTNIDLKLFLENYNVDNLEYINGYMFKGMQGIFDDYIDYWSNVKIESKKNGNSAMYQIAKIMLNGLYGKFASAKEQFNKYPYLDSEDNIVKYYTPTYFDEVEQKEKRKPTKCDGVYLPMAIFITSYAREVTQRASGKIKEYSLNKYNEDMYI
ncbi:MAG: hypothetical protein NC200_07830, partial [Candidatus Gastranaerophilales bacterium]|nr:hypothetical protein [Candidatus Gastranaerophilales bacterium]